ncbi:hypothetical protein ES332_A02G001400v1 [Gossypium tomentosum]|uniref:Bromo domain-containing protein n=1 Tax=Gossypium tomentosum TaxID=34277 RepID=A0A5D2RCS7_GOSTO|nr:hypothetical protein ES332_A02G001400v1 [Gossypium tomentosum]
MPEKPILERILDILQRFGQFIYIYMIFIFEPFYLSNVRRDTYEIFAEPVDPEKVEGYYEIIKEPMDFGTMRAKLHEGMYTSLQQFEHDVYLIPQNAMHFNSPTTIYFKQARAIYELAQKAFSCLKNDPKNLESEFSETKRRTNRRIMYEAKAPSSSKLTTNLRSNIKTNLSSKSMSCFLGNSGGFDSRDYGIHSGAINCKRNSYVVGDKRCTYAPWTSLLTENASIVSTDPTPLGPVNQQDIGYKDSLMLFVKDLGPTAQMVAKRKLMGCWVGALFQQPECEYPNAFGSTQKGFPRATVNISDHLHSHRGPTNYKGQMRGDDDPVDRLNEKQLESCQLKLSIGGGLESRCYSKQAKVETSSAPPTQIEENRLDLRSRKDEVEARKGFIFDLPFLKKRLHEINSLGK